MLEGKRGLEQKMENGTCIFCCLGGFAVSKFERNDQPDLMSLFLNLILGDLILVAKFDSLFVGIFGE